MFHYIDHKDRQGQPRTACGQKARHVWTPVFWERSAFLDYQGNRHNGTGPADRCRQCERVAKGTKHATPRTLDEYTGLWAAVIRDPVTGRDQWTNLGTLASISNANARYNARHA